MDKSTITPIIIVTIIVWIRISIEFQTLSLIFRIGSNKKREENENEKHIIIRICVEVWPGY